MVAEDTSNKKSSRRLRVAAPTTVRQAAEKQQIETDKPVKTSRFKATSKVAVKPLRATGRGAKKVARPFRFMSRPLRFIAKLVGIRYFYRSWKELQLVQWPSRKESRQLTSAVIVFATVFGVIIASLDYGLDKLFKLILIK